MTEISRSSSWKSAPGISGHALVPAQSAKLSNPIVLPIPGHEFLDALGDRVVGTKPGERLEQIGTGPGLQGFAGLHVDVVALGRLAHRRLDRGDEIHEGHRRAIA